MIYSVGYRPRFKLLDGKAGSLIYSPGIQVGVITGKAYSAVIKEDEQVIDKFITRPVITDGGAFSIGADEYIFDEVTLFKEFTLITLSSLTLIFAFFKIFLDCS